MPRQQLVPIGASAGWMLPTAWLSQFDEIHAWDIDPLAAPLFRWRHERTLKRQGTALHLHTGDGLALLPDIMRAASTFSGLTTCWGNCASPVNHWMP
jgi:hypothetical protein